MCARTFRQCVGEVLIARGKIDQAKLDKITKSGVIKKVRKVGYGACLKDCNKAKGAPSDTAHINKCMQLDDCKAFAKCMMDVEWGRPKESGSADPIALSAHGASLY